MTGRGRTFLAPSCYSFCRDGLLELFTPQISLRSSIFLETEACGIQVLWHLQRCAQSEDHTCPPSHSVSCLVTSRLYLAPLIT